MSKINNKKRNNNRRRSQRNTKNQIAQIKGWIKENRKNIAIIVSIFILISFLFYLKIELGKTPDIDTNTLCFKEKYSDIHNIVLIDKSEEWDNDDIKRLQILIESIYTKIPYQGRLTVTAITSKSGDSTLIDSLFDKCNPGSGSKDQCSGFYQNCKHIKKRYDFSFGEPMQKLTLTLSKPGRASYSPLFETIVQIIDDNKSENLEINFISDLMENSEYFRFDELIPLADDLVQAFPIKTKANVIVHANFIDRTRHNKIVKTAAQNVWRNYFTKQGIGFNSERLLITKK